MKQCSFISTSRKCTCASIGGTEVRVCGLGERTGGAARTGGAGPGESGSAAPRTESGAEGELVLLDGLFDPGPQAGLVEGLDERLLGGVVLAGGLLGVVVRAGLQHLGGQDGRQLKGRASKSQTKGIELYYTILYYTFLLLMRMKV